MARSRRFAVEVVAYSVLTAIGALALVAGVAGVRVLAYNGTRAQASAEAQGRLVNGYRPSDEEALVVWNDQEGEEESTWFVLDEPEKWAPGQAFRVRYDPTENDHLGPYAVEPERENVVSGEPGAHNAAHDAGWDYWWPTAVMGGLVSLVLLAWAVRGRLNRSAAAAPPVPMRAVVLRGRSSALGTKDSMVLMLAPPEPPVDADELDGYRTLPRELPGFRRQRVYWHPALEQVEPGATVMARIKDGFGTRAVVELGDGALVWPAGSLRAKAHRGITYTVQAPRKYQRYAKLSPPLVVWLVPIPAGLFSATRGHFLADAPLIILGLVVLTTFVWAWYTPAPEE